jgi:uncharacterized protein (DUF433 family)
MEPQTVAVLETTQVVPLQAGVDGAVRVGNTRVTLDTLVLAFKEGATAEEIAQQYPSVALADVYHTIGYYLSRTAEIEAYLQRRHAEAERVRRQNEPRFDPSGIRDRLLARQTSERP